MFFGSLYASLGLRLSLWIFGCVPLLVCPGVLLPSLGVCSISIGASASGRGLLLAQVPASVLVSVLVSPRVCIRGAMVVPAIFGGPDFLVS